MAGGAVFAKPPRAEIERRAREDYLKAFPKGKPEAPKIANVRTLVARDRSREIECRGITFVLPHLNVEDGLTLQLFVQTELVPWHDKTPTWETLDAYVETCRNTAAMLWSLCYARGWRRMVPRKWLRNPMQDFNDKELGEIAGFFLQCRTTSSVRLFPATTAQS